MRPEVMQTMIDMVDKYVRIEEFNKLLKECVYEKGSEQTGWGEITRYAHLMLGGSSPHLDRTAAITEMIMLAADIADDLQDQDNKDKLWMQYRQEYVINGVLALLMGAVAESAELTNGKGGPVTLTREISRILLESLNGQFADLEQNVTTEQQYIAMVYQKSGSLIHLACYMGYAELGLDSKAAGTMKEIAYYSGIIAQLENDLKDLLRFDMKNDILRKKRTLPILYLLSAEESFPYMKQYYEGKLTQSDLLAKKQECIDYINDSGCMEYSKIIQTLHRQKAAELLESLTTVSPWREKFQQVTLITA
ncbi:polyprenyl synthetase family protein [Paenibacillus sp. MSJ-34]|uniref:polyprenyl synthetase family protein n=1 Tax=Paenibacillus sp. MSJ-34 TaxID=2841529 RepID=UPI001C10DF67|nr:polyprenyl synthetase family protein [Paenibacillus sp. MSJ-34]MBU5445361.1 polyprenyl synthetase family protein [Paenibacillus sp. MSJ-34]